MSSRVSNDWGYDTVHGWWYTVMIDGRFFAKGHGYDTMDAMSASVRRDLGAAERRVSLEIDAQAMAEASPRAVVVVAPSESVASGIGPFVAQRLGLPAAIGTAPMALFGEVPAGVRCCGLCLVGLDLTEPAVRTWVSALARGLHSDQVTQVGCTGSLGRDLLRD